MESINYDLGDLHQVQLNLFQKLISVCKEYHLNWFIGFGTLLGAVRNNKIIPWDDSIDVVMPWPDYDKLTNLPQDVWGDDIFLQTYYTDPQYMKFYAKLRDSSTTLIMADYVDCDINQGIYINIMPIIRLSDNAEERKRQLKDAKLYKAITEKQPLPADEGSLRLYSSILLGSTSEHKKTMLREELKAKVIGYEGKNTKDCFVLAGNISLTLVLPSEWFATSVEWEFEGITVNIPAGWREWLTLRYGDYMMTPVSDLQGDKISRFVTLNTQRPYTDYKGKTYCI